MTTAVLKNTPAEARSKNGTTSTTLSLRATPAISDTVRPSSGSAQSNHLGSCSAQKYGPLHSSCSPITCTPSAAAASTSATCRSSASSLVVLPCACATAARTTRVIIRLSSCVLAPDDTARPQPAASLPWHQTSNITNVV